MNAKSKPIVSVYDFENPNYGGLCAVSKFHKGLKEDDFHNVVVCIVPKFNKKEFLSTLKFTSGHKYTHGETGPLAKGMFMFSKVDGLYIFSLATHPDHQSRGLAKDLLEFCVMPICEKQYPIMKGDILTDGDYSKRFRFFKNRGFEFVEKHSYGSISIDAHAETAKLKSPNPNKFVLNKKLSDKETILLFQ